MQDNHFQEYLDAGLKFGLPEKLLYALYHIISGPDLSFYKLTFEKVLLMYNVGFSIEKISYVLSESIEYSGIINLERFYKIINKDLDKLNISKDQINYEINAHRDIISQTEKENIPATKAIEQLKYIEITDKLINEIMDHIVTNPGAPPADLTVNNMALETIDFLLLNNVPESEIIPIISKSMRDDKTFSNDKFRKYYKASKYISSGAAISKIDGNLKIKIHTQFLKYINEILQILRDNADEIKNLSKKYSNDMKSFANEFYKFYITKKGFADIAPELNIVDSDGLTDYQVLYGEFNPIGILTINLSENITYANIINAIIHELAHFEQYLWIIHTETLGLEVFTKRMIAESIINATGGYERIFKVIKPNNKILSPNSFGRSIYKYIENDMEKILEHDDFFQEISQNDFYINAKNSKYTKPISTKDPKFPFLKQLAIDLMGLANPEDGYTYHKLSHEKMAFAAGNAASIAFQKIVYGNEFSAKQQFGQIKDSIQK